MAGMKFSVDIFWFLMQLWTKRSGWDAVLFRRRYSANLCIAENRFV